VKISNHYFAILIDPGTTTHENLNEKILGIDVHALMAIALRSNDGYFTRSVPIVNRTAENALD
jgi:hypothetical protein